MLVKLYKKNDEYTTNSGEKKKVTNYFVECGDVLVPVVVKFFEDKETHTDKQYATRRTLMSAFAEELPERKPTKNTPTEQSQAAVADPTA